MSNLVNNQDIINYYDYCETDYKLLWHLNDLSALHYGFWNSDTLLLRDALKNMNDQVLDRLDIKPFDNILDAGCGIGGTSLYGASRYPSNFYGISLSEKQIQSAKRNQAKKSNSLGQCEFSVQDFCKTNFNPSFFNGIFGIESICHANNKAEFLKEAYRILNQNGIFVIADFFRNKKQYKTSEEKLIKNWAHSWAVPDFISYEEFISYAKAQGFILVSDDDVTSHIKRTAKRLYYCFFPGVFCDFVLRSVGKRNAIHQKNVWSTYYQYHCFKENLCSYRIIKFVKPNI